MVKTLLIYFDIAVATFVAMLVANAVDTDIAGGIATDIDYAAGTEFPIEVAATVAVVIATCSATNIAIGVATDITTDIDVPTSAFDT